MKISELFNSILKQKEVLKYLDLLKKYHKETYEHSLRVGFLSGYLGNENNFPKDEIKLLIYSGLLHDIGKLDMPKKILLKKSKLNDKEKKIIGEHPRIGFLKLKNFKFKEVKEIIVRSHEHKKNPYPRHEERRKLKRIYDRRKEHDVFERLSQVLAMADMYDALAYKRAYKEKLSNKEIKEILRKDFLGDKIYIDEVFDISNKRVKDDKSTL